MASQAISSSHVCVALSACASTLHEWQRSAELLRQRMHDNQQAWRARIIEVREQLNQTNFLTDLREALRHLPREVRHRAFARQFSQRLDAFERECHCFNDCTETESFVSRLSHAVTAMRDELTRFESDPVMQKFLRGERVLACRTNIQWGRKIGHAFFGVSAVYLVAYSSLAPWIVQTMLFGFVAACLSLETARHMNPRVNDWVIKWFRPVMREAEKTRINSAMFYMASLIIVYALTPLPVAVASTLFLALGDPVAGVIGSAFGRTKLAPHVSLEGFLACAVVCMLSAGFVALTLTPATFGVPVVVASLFAGFAGAVAESAFKVIDDNLTVPLISAPIVWSLFKLFDFI